VGRLWRLPQSRTWATRTLLTATERQHTTPLRRADGLADIELPDHAGRPVRLGDLWRDQPAVLVWLRHYG
jgi:hypothetical protein